MLDELIHPSLLHPVTGEPLKAVGVVNGRPVWPVLGGAEGDDADDSADDDANDDSTDEDDSDDDKGGKGDEKKPEDDPTSIEYWKKRSRLNEREAKKAKRERDALAAAGKDDKKDDDAPDPEKIKADAKAEARAEVLRDRVSDKIEAKARKFADPEDAVAILLRQNDIEDFIDDGKVDVDAITEALTDLAKKKPHLLAKGKRFEGGGDGGARKETGKSIEEQIAEAEKARDFQKAIALKQRRAAEAKASK